MTTFIEKNGQIMDEFDKNARDGENPDGFRIDSDNGPEETGMTVPAEQSKLDSVRRVSSGIYQTTSEVIGYGMSSVKRAATGLGAGITRAGQNVADKMQKSPKIPKSVKKRSEVDELSANILSDDSDDDDDDGTRLMMKKKSAKEVAARKKRKDMMKKEEQQTW